ncbi:MAG TPA: translation elongation factor Ts [Leptospiraceae bacterium]|jgi:elongation factor Ts|nr:translation elongation factor Ts [Leptospirales bacterium]HMU85242.1 translation elongation factor Ts [Leptospiraceae bacterium]HMY44729.1 translation elongation factor Ts [Leptospiraceae bacterium]HNE25229.1 translation elongation factor Ts [Leptospiraceae bacterium]HNJ34591.1 translation elongation factor Ts [Leptospiraceae bacterium]
MAEVKSDDIKKLREMTGAGMMDCKSALAENAGDIEKASEALRKKGLAKAAKRMDRDTGSGRVFSYIHGEGKIGVLLQLNCETDFVAKNEEFEQLGKDLCMQVAAASPLAIKAEDLDPKIIEKETEVYREQLIQEKKKPEQIEKILPGKIKKFQQDVCLLDQFFIKDNKQTVAELIKSFIGKFGENITISRFTRYEAG